MGNSNWCVDCNKVLRGKSFKYGLCYVCRNSDEINKIYCSRVDMGIPTNRDDIIKMLKTDNQ